MVGEVLWLSAARSTKPFFPVSVELFGDDVRVKEFGSEGGEIPPFLGSRTVAVLSSSPEAWGRLIGFIGL